jgi:effector-binding domain-containing protein
VLEQSGRGFTSTDKTARTGHETLQVNTILAAFCIHHNPIYNLHHFPRDRFTSTIHRESCKAANTVWRDIAGL